MLAVTIKQKMIAAMKAKDTVAKEILKVTLGELDVLESRSGDKPDDAQAAKVVKKLMKSNEETLALARTDEERATLKRELEVLAELLPKSMSAEEVAQALAGVRDQIVGAAGDGAATGIAMKHLKSIGADVDGKTVSAAVQQLRA